MLYDGVIYYFNKFYPEDADFNHYVSSYLLGETVLFQYNKSLLFKSYEYLPFNETIFKNNYNESKPFWIVQYHLIEWLIRCNRNTLAIESYKGSNYYILQKIYTVKTELMGDIDAKKLFIESLIDNIDPMVSLQGLLLWDTFIPFTPPPSVDGTNGYSKRILTNKEEDYFSYVLNNLYRLTPSSRFLSLIIANSDVFAEAKDDIRGFVNYRDLNPSVSLMNLDLLHNIIFDVIAAEQGYTTGDFGACLSQMQNDFPLAFYTFQLIHETRNQKSIAHYKDKSGNPRVRISKPEYDNLLKKASLCEAYEEIFDYYLSGVTV